MTDERYRLCVYLLSYSRVIVTEPTKKPTSGTSSESLSGANEIIPGSTEKPVRQPPKVTTTIVVTQRPTLTTPVSVTQQQPAIAIAQQPTLATSRPPFVTTFHNKTSELKDFVCQIGRGQCQALFRGTAWTFRAQPFQPSKYIEVVYSLANVLPARKNNCCSFIYEQTSWSFLVVIIRNMNDIYADQIKKDLNGQAKLDTTFLFFVLFHVY